MALPDYIVTESGTPVVWANLADFGGGHGFTRTHQIGLTSLANNAAREGAKADLGATRPGGYAVRCGIEMDVAPTAGNTIELYWSASESATAGTGNDGGAAGADQAYKAAEEDEWKKQLTLIGVLVLTADLAPIVQIQTINGFFIPPSRYGMPVVINKGGQAFEGDAVEMFVALIPAYDKVVDSL